MVLPTFAQSRDPALLFSLWSRRQLFQMAGVGTVRESVLARLLSLSLLFIDVDVLIPTRNRCSKLVRPKDPPSSELVAVLPSLVFLDDCRDCRAEDDVDCSMSTPVLVTPLP